MLEPLHSQICVPAHVTRFPQNRTDSGRHDQKERELDRPGQCSERETGLFAFGGLKDI